MGPVSFLIKEFIVNTLEESTDAGEPTVYKITLVKLLISIGLAGIALVLIWQVMHSSQSVEEAIADTGTLRQTIYMTWASIALFSSALGTVKWGWLGFWMGWLTGFIMAPAILLLVIMIRTGF